MKPASRETHHRQVASSAIPRSWLRANPAQGLRCVSGFTGGTGESAIEFPQKTRPLRAGALPEPALLPEIPITSLRTAEARAARSRHVLVLQAGDTVE